MIRRGTDLWVALIRAMGLTSASPNLNGMVWQILNVSCFNPKLPLVLLLVMIR